MTHHKDCLRLTCVRRPLDCGKSREPCNCCDCTCPVEPYTAHMAEGMAQAIDSGLPVNSPALAATLRAYAAQGKRVEELERDLSVANLRGDAYFAVFQREETRAEKAEAALGEAVGLLDDAASHLVCRDELASCRMAADVRAFLAKQEGK